MPKINPWVEVATKRARKEYYPSSPSDEEIKMYDRFFKEFVCRRRKPCRVLVLGATPSLRDIGLKYKCEVVAVDISMEMILRMSEYMRFKNHPKEVIVRGNWLNIPLQDNYFDIAMGDFIFCNVWPKDNLKLFRAIWRVLKPKGVLLIRQRVHLPDFPLRTYGETAKRFRRGEIKWRDLKYNTVFSSTDVFSRYSLKTKLFYWERYFKAWQKAYQRDELSKKEFQSMWQERCKIISSLFTKREFEGMMKKYFKIIKEDWCKVYESSQSSPFYIGIKKG